MSEPTPLAQYLVDDWSRYAKGCLFESGVPRSWICLSAFWDDSRLVDPVVEAEPMWRPPLCSVYCIVDEGMVVGNLVSHHAKCHVRPANPSGRSAWLRFSARKSYDLEITAAQAMADESWCGEDTGILRLFWREEPKFTVLHTANAAENEITRIIKEL